MPACHKAGLLKLAAAGLALLAGPAAAGEADIVEAGMTRTGEGTYRVSATVRHADTGWEHYADGFIVRSRDGQRLGERVLHHPHVDNQPFTRSLRELEIPVGIDQVVVAARDSEHGFGGATVTVAVPK